MTTDTNNPNTAIPKPLAQKTDAELKRETKARLRHMSPTAASELMDEFIDSPVAEPIIGFVDFLREKAVVGLAIGFVIGTQVQGVATTFIRNIINPLLDLLLPGNGELAKRSLYVRLDQRSASFGWGAVVYALIDFLLILLVMYAAIKLLRLDKLDKKK